MAATIESPKSARSPPLRKAKILMLHGHAESGPKFYAKTRPLEKHLYNTFPPAPLPGFLPEFPDGIELFYPTAPLRLTGADATRGCGPVDLNNYKGEVGLVSNEKDLDAWAWGTGNFRNAEKIHGVDQSVGIILEFMRAHGPFIGVIGFSCGATLAAILASLLESNKKVTGWRSDNFDHPPLRFAVCYSGFMLKYSPYRPCYYPKINTPILHIIGAFDPMTEESQTLDLAKRCRNGRVLYHPGSHYVPMNKCFVKAVTDFIDSKLGIGKEDDDSDWVDI